MATSLLREMLLESRGCCASVALVEGFFGCDSVTEPVSPRDWHVVCVMIDEVLSGS